MLKDRDQRVVPAVLDALVAAKAPGAEQILLEHLKADDFVVRAAAATGLAELKAVAALPALIAALSQLGWRQHLRGARGRARRRRADRPDRRPVRCSRRR